MSEIEQILNDGLALSNFTDSNPLRHDDKYRHQIIILIQVVNDAAPCLKLYG